MKHFEHISAYSLEEAAEAVKKGAKIIAGGTDLLGVLKDKIETSYPKEVVDIKTIDGLNKIDETAEGIRIGANVKLSHLAENSLIKEQSPALAQAAYSVASPLIRNQATLGGNLCQDSRCWYYRYPHHLGGRIVCSRKGGDSCKAFVGDNRYSSIFGGMRVHASACSQSCPVHVDIPQYLERVRENDLDGAAKILLRKNPLAAATSRVCSHFCMEGCRREDYDHQVNIGQVERFVGDYILENADRLMTPPVTESGKKIAIIGAGPAALSAAYYLREAGHAVTVYDRMEEPGGLLMYAIPEYRLPKEKVRQLTRAIASMGVEFKQKVNVGEDIQVDEIASQYDSIFLDTGAWKRNIIGIAGEELTEFGLDFLVEVKQWMQNKPGSNVIVVGGGNVAVDVAVTAKRLGAATVTMVSLETMEQMPATKEEIERALEEGILHEGGWGPVEVIKDQDSVTGLKLKKCIRLRNEEGHFAPLYDEANTKILEGDAILLAVGQKIDLSYLDERLAVETQQGKIVTSESQMTNLPGVFAGGDAVTGPSTVVSAIATGRSAAECICNYLGTDSLLPGPIKEGFVKHEVNVKSYRESVKANLKPASERTVDSEDDMGLDYEAVAQEAKRCFNCSCYAVNPSDISTALMAVHAMIETNYGTYSADDFFGVNTKIEDVLKEGEIVTAVIVPNSNGVSAYDKFRERESIDFAVVGLGTKYKVEDNVIEEASIVMGAVAPVPIRAVEAEKYLIGQKVTEEVAKKAAEIALSEAEPLEENGYKIMLIKTMITRSILNLI